MYVYTCIYIYIYVFIYILRHVIFLYLCFVSAFGVMQTSGMEHLFVIVYSL